MGSIIRYQPSVGVSAPRVNPTTGIGEGLQQAGRDVQAGLSNMAQAAWFLERQDKLTDKLKYNGVAEIEAANFLGGLADEEAALEKEARTTNNVVDFRPKLEKLYNEYPTRFRGGLTTKYEQPDMINNLVLDKVGSKFTEMRAAIAKKDTANAVHVNKKLYAADVQSVTQNSLGSDEEVLASFEALAARGQKLVDDLALEPEKHAQILSEVVGKVNEARWLNSVKHDPLNAISRQEAFLEKSIPYLVPETLRQLNEGVLKGRDEFQKYAGRVLEQHIEKTQGLRSDEEYDALAEGAKLDLGPVREIVAKVRQRNYTAINNQHMLDKRALELKSEATAKGLVSEMFKQYAEGARTGSVLVSSFTSLINAKTSDLTSDDIVKVRSFSDALINSKENNTDDTDAAAGVQKMIRVSPKDPSIPRVIAQGGFTRATKLRLYNAYNDKLTVLDNEEKALMHEAMTKGMARLEDTMAIYPKGRADQAVNDMYGVVYDALINGDKAGASPEQRYIYKMLKTSPERFFAVEIKTQHKLTRDRVYEDGRHEYEYYKTLGYDIRSTAQLSAMAKVGLFDLITHVGKDKFQALVRFVDSMNPIAVPFLQEAATEADAILKQDKKDNEREFQRRGK